MMYDLDKQAAQKIHSIGDNSDSFQSSPKLSSNFTQCYFQFNLLNVNYSLTESKVFTRKSQSLVQYGKAEVYDCPLKTERASLISCYYMAFLLWFYRPIIGPWALRKNNALELARQNASYIGYEQKPYNNVSLKSIFFPFYTRL